MAVRRVKSPYPIYAVGAVWALWALFLPLYQLSDFLLCAGVSIAAYALTRRFLWRDAVLTVPDPVPEPKTEEEKALAQLKAEGERAISEMRRLNAAIRDEKVSAQIDHLEEVTGKIFQAVAESPEKRPQLRRFLSYYLPTTLKILNAYDRMADAGVEGENIGATKDKVEGMLDLVCQAFDKQLDALFGAEALDISTDIAVMEQMLAREGLGGTQMPGV